MKILMSRINAAETVSDSQIATRNGKIVYVRMCLINR